MGVLESLKKKIKGKGKRGTKVRLTESGNKYREEHEDDGKVLMIMNSIDNGIDSVGEISDTIGMDTGEVEELLRGMYKRGYITKVLD